MKKQYHVSEQTRKNLINGFWELYKDENTNKITVNNICKKANYERTTFYRYFLDTTDILKQLEEEIINNIKTDIKNNSKSKKNPSIFLDGFKNFTDKYGEYIVFFNEKGNKNFYNKFKELIKKDVYDYLNFKIENENQKEFLFEFMFSSLINSYTYWYKNQEKLDFKSFVMFANNILINGTKIIISYTN